MDTCLRLCLNLSTCTLRENFPTVLCKQTVTVSTETVDQAIHEQRPADRVPLAAVPRPAICSQTWRRLTNYVPKTRCLPVRHISQ